MPTRIYAPNAGNPSISNWQTPSSISIYNGGWNTVKVAYTYDMGVWKVVYPDPIIPSITISSGPYAEQYSVYVNLIFNNAVSVYAELFQGTSQGTPVQTATYSLNGNLNESLKVQFFNLLNNTTYNMRITATSVTENTASILTGSITVIVPTVSITSITNISISGATINWSSTNQTGWRVIIRKQSDQSEVYRSSLGMIYNSNTSVNASFSGTANTNYTVQLDIESSTFSGATAYGSFTTPNVLQPKLNSFSATKTCNSITVSWSGTDYVSGYVALYDIFFSQSLGPQWSGEITNPPRYNFTTQTSYTFTGLSSNMPYGYRIFLTSSTNTVLDSNSNYGVTYVTTDSVSAPPPPSNFTATSSTYGNIVTLSWTIPPTGACYTNNDGYTIQYKESSATTWSLVSNTISSTSNTYSTSTAGITLTANTAYDFRIFTRSSPTNSTYAYASVTTNNTPYSLSVYTLPIAATTFSAVTVYAQLKNISGGDVSLSGRTATFSATAGRGTFSATTANTNANGTASVTYTTNETTGNISFSATATGVPFGGSYTLGVGLSPGLTPSLSVSRTNFGYDIIHSNYNSSYSYSGSVTNGGFLSGGNWNTSFYTIIIPPINTSAPVASRNGLVNLTCTQGSWNVTPSATTTVTSSRTGYNDASASVTNSPTGVITATRYDWYYDNGTLWRSDVQSPTIGSGVRGRTVRCLVTITRTGGNQASAWSNFVSVPA